MSIFVEIDHVDKVFPLSGGGRYVALKNIELKVNKGEFVSLIGHSGCGKSTLLNIVAGFETASTGGVVLEGREIDTPGPDRMMVFQNYSLLPWLTVRQNIALAVNKVMKSASAEERHAIIEKNIQLVNLTAAADKKPGQLSGGMKQRTAIARALAIRPKMLLLDEPFGALDALTRGNLQEQLMEICQAEQITCMMVTHDVDEALLLSDRVVMLTNGPEAHIGQILEVNIPRPRKRLDVVNHPDYYDLRNQMIYFLNQQRKDKRRKARVQTEAPAGIPAVAAVKRGMEKKTITLGYVPTTDAAPLIVAQEKGLFQKYGFESVNLQREQSWNAIADGLINGQLDAAQMLAGMPLAIGLGAGGQAMKPISTALVLSRNGNAITLNKGFQEKGVTTLADLKSVIASTPDNPHVFGIVHDASMGSLLLRYWLAAGGIDPDKDVALSLMSSSEMQTGLANGSIDGYFAAEPWNSRAVLEQAGYVVATDLELWASHQSKVLAVPTDWMEQHPETHKALLKALLEACQYCDDPRNREEIVQLLSQERYLGISPAQLRPGFSAAFDRGNGSEPKLLSRLHQFAFEQSTCPRRMEALWLMTQMARWGITPFPKNWMQVLERTYRLDLYGQAARELGLPDAEPTSKPVRLFDGVIFNPDDPLNYLESLQIKRPIVIQEIPIEPAPVVLRAS